MARIEFYAQAALLKQQLTTGGNRTKIQRRTNREATQSDHVNHTQSRAVLRIIQVSMNHLNKDGKPSAEGEEGRPLIKENTHQSSTPSTQSETRVSLGLAGVRKAAKDRKELKFTALLHHLTIGLLRDSFYVAYAPSRVRVGNWKHSEPFGDHVNN